MCAATSRVPPLRDVASSGGSVAGQPALLTAVVESAMDAVVAHDAEQRIVLFNPAAEAMFRRPASTVLGQPLDKLLPARLRPMHHAHVAGFLATGATSRAMGHLRPLIGIRADGEEFPIEATISHVVIDGRRYGAAIVRDISARLAAEQERAETMARAAAAQAEALAAAAERDHLRETLDGLPSGVFIVNAEPRIMFANTAFIDMALGPSAARDAIPEYGRDVSYARVDGSPLPWKERPGVIALSGERVRNRQLLLVRADGSQLAVAAHAAPLRSGPGAVAEAIVVVQDVTRLRQAEQLKDDFLALISHEFRTPLTTIHGGARLLSRDAGSLDEAAAREILDDVVAESERLDRMLRNILTLTDVMGGRLTVATEPVLLRRMIEPIARTAEARSPRHTFPLDAAADLPPVEADPDLLEEIIRNLFENAVKYSPEGGEIRTVVSADRGVQTIAITDHGIGIAPEHTATVFERFRRVGGNPTIRGMGLGLYLSRHLVEAQGGAIAATSPGPGRGATFTVALPVATGWAAPGGNDDVTAEDPPCGST